ncbi:hypothetical protein EIN_041070 [Entamoeba invadens IP1]|uniref:Uncharacterized protein n=1 Tax=Entamoeba invadens IP1 TaxID=370355 RepID=A0A0A1TZ58_ENTIV|nr:hypothetical protein EIN_041070 [Entamoeba invadens IP1]ELP85493.1 hypothetical protein EIN_041070 [Entamoeba invadens IP1]|eukprot:XP_004184839.1 hypothetical protein EIN_041070 [Entamoeba invadens IP1]
MNVLNLVGADRYYTKLATCNEQNSYNFTTTKDSITFNYYDSKCETPNADTPKISQRYDYCTFNNEENYVIYYYGKNSIDTPPDNDNSFGVIISIIAMMVLALI